MQAPTTIQTPAGPVAGRPTKAAELRELAVEFEASFLSEMLKSAGVGESPEEFSGGIGESQFASFLRDAQAREMARAGGLGLAESIFESLKDGKNGV